MYFLGFLWGFVVVVLLLIFFLSFLLLFIYLKFQLSSLFIY